MRTSIKPMLALLMLVVACFCLPGIASAQQAAGGEPVFDIFTLSGQAEAEVGNDLMTVDLVVQAQGPDSAELANAINANMGWALTRLREFPTVQSQTRDYQTFPRRERNGSRIIGWNASQQLQLKSDDFENCSKAVQILQERLQVQGINMSVKAETRKAAEDRLINEALDAFKQRALLIQQNMGASNWRIMNVVINSSGMAMPHMADVRMSQARSFAPESAPAVQAGSSRVQLRVDGRIQLE